MQKPGLELSCHLRAVLEVVWAAEGECVSVWSCLVVCGHFLTFLGPQPNLELIYFDTETESKIK